MIKVKSMGGQTGPRPAGRGGSLRVRGGSKHYKYETGRGGLVLGK